MKIYYESLGENPFNYIPLTFHIKDGVDSEEFRTFVEKYKEYETLGEEDITQT
jgi:tubulin--tyrosine ligase